MFRTYTGTGHLQLYLGKHMLLDQPPFPSPNILVQTSNKFGHTGTHYEQDQKSFKIVLFELG